MIELSAWHDHVLSFLKEGIGSCLKKKRTPRLTSLVVCCWGRAGMIKMAMECGDTADALIGRGVEDCRYGYAELEIPEWEQDEGDAETEDSSSGENFSYHIKFEQLSCPMETFIVHLLKSRFDELGLPETVLWISVQDYDGGWHTEWEVNRKAAKPQSRPRLLKPWPAPLRLGSGVPLFAPDGRHLLLHTGPTSCWDLHSREKVSADLLPKGAVPDSFSPDGTLLAISAGHGALKIYTWPTLNLVTQWKIPGAWNDSKQAFSPCGRFIVQGCSVQAPWPAPDCPGEKSVLLAFHDTRTGECVHSRTFDAIVFWGLFPAAGKLVYHCPIPSMPGNQWQLMDWKDGWQSGGVAIVPGKSDDLECIAPSASFGIMKRAHFKKPVRKTRDSELRCSYSLHAANLPDLAPLPKIPRNLGDFESVNDVKIDPSGRFLCAAVMEKEDKTGFRFWSLPDLAASGYLPMKYAQSATFSPDGEYVALRGDAVLVYRTADIIGNS